MRQLKFFFKRSEKYTTVFHGKCTRVLSTNVNVHCHPIPASRSSGKISSLKSPFESKQTTHKVPYDPLDATYRWFLSEGLVQWISQSSEKKDPTFSQFLRLEICIWGKSFKRQKERCINWKWTTQERKRNAITDRKRKPAIEAFKSLVSNYIRQMLLMQIKNQIVAFLAINCLIDWKKACFSIH